MVPLCKSQPGFGRMDYLTVANMALARHICGVLFCAPKVSELVLLSSTSIRITKNVTFFMFIRSRYGSSDAAIEFDMAWRTGKSWTDKKYFHSRSHHCIVFHGILHGHGLHVSWLCVWLLRATTYLDFHNKKCRVDVDDYLEHLRTYEDTRICAKQIPNPRRALQWMWRSMLQHMVLTVHSRSNCSSYWRIRNVS